MSVPPLPTLRPGSLLVGIDHAPPVPLQIGSPQTGDLRGYEVDLLEGLAHRLAVTLVYQRGYWSAIVDDLAAGRLDIVCSAATVTPERRARVDFCRPHLSVTLAVVVRADDQSGIALERRRLGVRAGTTAEAYARAHGAAEPLQRSESNEELYAALAASQIDAIIDDNPIAAHFARAVAGLRLAGTLSGSDASYAIMVRKGNDALRHALDAALETLQADGTLRRLQAQWGL